METRPCYYKNVYSFLEINNNNYFSESNYVRYRQNNWRDYVLRNFRYIFSKIERYGCAIWLTSKGDICYRLSIESSIHTGPINKINLVLSNFLKQDIQITNNSKKQTEKDDIQYISTNELILIESEVFRPYKREEFFKRDNLIYRNTFKPSYFLSLDTNNTQINESIILKYIYYLANYDQDRFLFIMNWLANFFKDISLRSNIPLVFIGKKESGKDIFFNEIIRPLFGKEYSVKITENILKPNNLTKVLKNKLFYNLDNISKTYVEENRLDQIISSLIEEKNFYIDPNSFEEVEKFGQILITVDEPNLIIGNNKNYVMFKVEDNIENIFILEGTHTKKFTKDTLVDEIRYDVVNFALILKSFKINKSLLNKPFQKDDKKVIESTLEDKLESFSNAIIEMNKAYFKTIEDEKPDLYNELVKDFAGKRVKQQNLIKYFNTLYKDEEISNSRTLMVKLRKINKDFFDTKAIKSLNGGDKYFCMS